MGRFRRIRIEGFEHYVVNEVGGCIVNLKTRKAIKGWVNSNGYRRVWLCNGKLRKKFYIHRLVAFAFIPNDDFRKTEVNHLDRVRGNCDASNLEWVTKDENLEYRYHHASKRFYKKKTEPVVLDSEPFLEEKTLEDLPF